MLAMEIVENSMTCESLNFRMKMKIMLISWGCSGIGNHVCKVPGTYISMNDNPDNVKRIYS